MLAERATGWLARRCFEGLVNSLDLRQAFAMGDRKPGVVPPGGPPPAQRCASAAAIFLLITYTPLGELNLAMNDGDSGGVGGIPLDTFNKNTPPGWRPGSSRYPLRRYIQ